MAELADGIAAAGVPGGAISIVCDGQLVRAEGVGVVAVGGAPVTSHTRFQLASVTKSLTAATILTLVDEGVLDLDDDVTAFVPFVNTREPYDRDATLAEILSHSAGYPTAFPDEDDSDVRLEGFFRNNGQGLLWSAPGAVFNYSNLGFALAGLVAQRASGTPFAELVEERLLGPAGMQDATLDAARVAAEPDYAVGHEGDHHVPIGPLDSYLQTGLYGPMGGAWASVEDLAHFGMLLAGRVPGVISDASLARMRTPRVRTEWPGRSYGLGLIVDEGSSPSVGHEGSVAGYLSAYAVLPEQGFGVFVVVNGETFYPWEVVNDAVATLTQWEPGWAPWFDDVTADAIVGTYVDGAQMGTVEVRDRAGTLEIVFRDAGGAVSPLVELWPGSWSFHDPFWDFESVATFWPGDDGAVHILTSLSFVASR